MAHAGWGIATAAAAAVTLAAGAARAQAQVQAQVDDDERDERSAAPGAELLRLRASGPPGQEDVPWGFYRDRQGRTMQVSFDLGRRVWLGVGYAPHRSPTGETELSPAAFDFGASYDELSFDGRTRFRFRFLDGQALVHPFGLDVTALRFDLSHRYQHPILRITTFIGAPARHDLYLNVGLYAEALRLEVAPRGVDGEEELTLGNLQGTLDLWQSADLRSYVRLRVGPGVEMRLGAWGDEARFVGFLPQAILEGNLLLGKRAMQLLTFKARGDFFRSLTVTPETLPGDWLADVEAAYEVILLAINDQPVSLRLAGQATVRDDARAVVVETPEASVALPGWEWKGTIGFRVSFFSPPVARSTP
jgi:hypothetical protein